MYYFRDFLPRLGMDYPQKPDLLNRKDQDKKLLIAFKKSAIIKTGFGASYNENEDAVDQALAEIFTLGLRPEALAHLDGEGGGVLQFLGALRTALPWARRIGESVFIRLCRYLVDARRAWRARPPFGAGRRRCATARGIDALLAAVGNRWNEAEFDLYGLVGGWDEEEEEEEEEEEGEHAGATEEVRQGIRDISLEDLIDLMDLDEMD